MSRIKEYPSITSFDGIDDALAIEQTDGANNRTRKVSPAQLKQYMEVGDFAATGEVKDGHGNVLKNMAKASDVDAEIGDLSQTGLTGDSVAAQLAAINSDLTIRDISSQATIDTTKVQDFKAFTYGKLIYIHLTLKPGVTDQTNVVTNLPYRIRGNYGVLPMFWMNAVDAASNGVCVLVDRTIQYRGSTSQGTGGTQYSGMFLIV